MDKLRDLTPPGRGGEGFRSGLGKRGEEIQPPPTPETKKVECCRAEIDTSPPFGSVEEAVTRFGGRGFWIPLHKLGDAFNGVEEVDMKRVEHQAAELEKALIAKHQETLDVLKDLEATKRFVDDLRLRLKTLHPHAHDHITSSSSSSSPSPPASIRENSGINPHGVIVNSSSSPDLILMELKQAKLNLSKTTSDLAVIRDSVESLNRKMKQEKSSLEKIAREKMAMDSRNRPVAQAQENPTSISRELQQLNSEAEQFIKMAEAAKSEVLRAMSGVEQTKNCMKTAEMRWVAAKKMEEAAWAAEAVALAEIRALSVGGVFCADEMSAATPRKKAVADHHNQHPVILKKKLEEAKEEVAESKTALEEALNRVETANRMKMAVEEALQRLKFEHHEQRSLRPVQSSAQAFISGGDARPPQIVRPSISIGDALSRKLMIPEGLGVRESGHNHKKVSLSQMLHRQSGTLSPPPPPPPPPPATAAYKEDEIDLKHYFAKGRKFGFIHLSLPTAKQSRKKMQPAHLR